MSLFTFFNFNKIQEKNEKEHMQYLYIHVTAVKQIIAINKHHTLTIKVENTVRFAVFGQIVLPIMNLQ